MTPNTIAILIVLVLVGFVYGVIQHQDNKNVELMTHGHIPTKCMPNGVLYYINKDGGVRGWAMLAPVWNKDSKVETC